MPKEVIHTETCECGETVSGPDVNDVKATMARHKAKNHAAKAKVAK